MIDQPNYKPTMGLFDIFKQKKDIDSVTTNDQVILDTEDLTLDALVEKAVQDPAYKPAFYQRIATEEVVVISINVNVAEGYQYLEAGTSVEVYSMPDGTIPIFTAIDRIFDNGIIKDDVEFLKMSGSDLFNMAAGENFIVNPYSSFKKKISSSKAQSLLDAFSY